MTLPRSIPGTCVSSIQSVLINHEPHFNFGSVFLDCVLLNCLGFHKILAQQNSDCSKLEGDTPNRAPYGILDGFRLLKSGRDSLLDQYWDRYPCPNRTPGIHKNREHFWKLAVWKYATRSTHVEHPTIGVENFLGGGGYSYKQLSWSLYTKLITQRLIIMFLVTKRHILKFYVNLQYRYRDVRYKPLCVSGQ